MLLAQVDQTPAAETRGERQGDVLADRALHQERLGPVGSDVDHTRADRIGRMSEGDRLAVHKELAALGTRGSRKNVEQLVLALAFKRHHAEHFAGVQLE